MEEQVVLAQFKKNHSGKGQIVLYGTGKYSKSLICHYSNEIVGVCDEYYDVASFCGKPVLNKMDVAQIKCRIVLVARPSSHKEIYSRIKDIEDEGHYIYNLVGMKIKDCMAADNSGDEKGYLNVLEKNILNNADGYIYESLSKELKKGEWIKSKPCIKTTQEFGATVLAHYLLAYLSWLYSTVNRKDYVIWFVARDGYLPHIIYERFKHYSCYQELPKSFYVLGSRRSFSVSSIFDEKDIETVLNCRGISGKADDILKKRFGVYLASNDWKMEGCDIKEYIMRYKDRIIKNAAFERENYISYITSKNHFLYDNILFFDFCTGGTGFRFAKKMLRDFDVNMKLLCFEYLNTDRECEDSLEYSWYGEGTFYSMDNILTTVFPIFEVLLSPNCPMFEFIDKSGEIHYELNYGAEYIDSLYWRKGISLIQNSCINKMDEIAVGLLSMMGGCSRIFSDHLLMALLSHYCNVSSSVKKLFQLGNSFENVPEVNVWDKFVDTCIYY